MDGEDRIIPFETNPDGNGKVRFFRLTQDQMNQVETRVGPVHLSAIEEFGTEVDESGRPLSRSLTS